MRSGSTIGDGPSGASTIGGGPSGSIATSTSAAAAPTVTSLTPSTGSYVGGTAITNLTGTGFVTGCTVTIGGAAATSVVFVSSSQLTCVTPAHAYGAATVVVTNPDTQTGTNASAFTYSAAPTDIASNSNWIRTDVGVSVGANTTWNDKSAATLNWTNGSYTGVAAVQNGKVGARFASASTNKLLLGAAGTTTVASLVTASAYTAIFVYQVVTFNTDSANTYDNGAIWSDGVGYVNYSFRATGTAAWAGHYDGADKKAAQTIAAGTTYVGCVWYDGTNIRHSINDAGTVATATGNLPGLTGVGHLGDNYTQAAFGNIYLFEACWFKTDIGATARTAQIAAMRDYWGV